MQYVAIKCKTFLAPTGAQGEAMSMIRIQGTCSQKQISETFAPLNHFWWVFGVYVQIMGRKHL